MCNIKCKKYTHNLRKTRIYLCTRNTFSETIQKNRNQNIIPNKQVEFPKQSPRGGFVFKEVRINDYFVRNGETLFPLKVSIRCILRGSQKMDGSSNNTSTAIHKLIYRVCMYSLGKIRRNNKIEMERIRNSHWNHGSYLSEDLIVQMIDEVNCSMGKLTGAGANIINWWR